MNLSSLRLADSKSKRCMHAQATPLPRCGFIYLVPRLQNMVGLLLCRQLSVESVMKGYILMVCGEGKDGVSFLIMGQ